MKKQQIIFKGSGRITTAAFIKNKNMRYGQIRFKGGGRINNVRITGLDNGGGGEEDSTYKDEECLGFTAVNGDVSVRLQNNGGNAPVVYYKREGQDWILWNYAALTIAEGETVRFYGDNNFIFSNSNSKYSYFVITGNGKINASGSCNSLLSKEKTKVITKYCFFYLFHGCTSLTTAPELPATTLADNCYKSMFEGCTSLTATPVLSAIKVADNCYENMFQNCTNLTTAPVLPATTLAYNCYQGMFRNCTNLTTAPTLPATTLANNCYIQMFYNCTSLTTAPELPATTLANGCYNGMFSYCTSLITAPELPATTLASTCYNQMFYGCTSLTTAPELPATTLANGCYNQMFYNCTNLNYIKALFTTTPSSSYTYNWVSGVQTTSGTFVKNAAATWDVSGVTGVPTNWTVETANS